MQELAQKLINLREKQTIDRLPSAIFGTISTLSQSLDNRRRVRIGLWPCISENDPEIAMGLFTALAFLLERWQEIRVYRLFVKVEEISENYVWELNNSQFSVNDWELDDLDENVAIWGQLDHKAGKWSLTIHIENDLAERIEQTLNYEAENLTDLVNKLPLIAQDIANNTDTVDTEIEAYTKTSANDDDLQVLLKSIFRLQVNLFLSLLGKTSLDGLEELQQAASKVGGEFGEWCISNALAHALLPGYDTEVNGKAEYMALQIINNETLQSLFPAIYISYALFRQGDKTQDAYEILNNGVNMHPTNPDGHLLLANLYQRGKQFKNAIETYQKAIEAQFTNTLLLQKYAQLLTLLSEYTGNYVLIEQEDLDDGEATAWEAITAYEDAIALSIISSKDYTHLLQEQLLLLADVVDEDEDFEQLWDGFSKLIDIDGTGEATRFVIDNLYNIEDVSPAINIIKQHIEHKPNRADLLINLAALYLIEEENNLAANTLEKAQKLSDEPEVLADIDELLLAANNPDFEVKLGEITTRIDMKNPLEIEDIQFLETCIENASSFIDAYILLAKAQIIDEDTDLALETLLDANKQNPEHPEVIEHLAQLLWDADEQNLAMEYLSKGIAANPLYVPLLALTGQFLFEIDNHEDAKLYMARAEAISPRNPVLIRVRANIARLLNEK